MEQVAAAAAVNDNDLRNAFPRESMLRPVKSAESLTTSSINQPQRTQSDRVACTTSKPGLAATLLASSENKPHTTDASEGSKAELPKRNACYVNSSNHVMESPTALNNSVSRQLSSVELDGVGELEKVCQAVTNLKNSIISNSRTSSPKCHSRSRSTDSYFERKLASSVVQFKMDDDSDEQDKFVESPAKTKHYDNASLDLSEIQVNFELEDNEMKIFSEDEAMLSNSCGSDLSKSVAGNSIFDDDFHFGNTKHTKITTKPSNSESTEENSTSPKNRRMSFREKFRIFTSPNSGRKTESNDCSEAQQNNASNEEPSKKTSIKKRVLGTLSPESLRKRNSILFSTNPASSEGQKQQTTSHNQVSPMKKKSSSPALGTSPNNTVILVKRSKIESNENTNDDLNDIIDSFNPRDDVFEVQSDPVPGGIPLSPSIQFMDESTESTSKYISDSGKK